MWGITIAVSVLLLVVMGLVFNKMWGMVGADVPLWRKAVAIGSAVMVVATLVVPYLIYPKRYEITDTEIIVHKNAKSRRIPFSQVASIYKIPPAKDNFFIRTFGVGGYLGTYGYFNETRLGKIYLEAADTSHVIIVELKNGKKVGFSDNEHYALLEAMQKAYKPYKHGQYVA